VGAPSSFDRLHVIREFNKKWEQDYLIKTAETLQAVIYRRNAALEKNAKRVCDSQTAVDITVAMGEGGGDDNEQGESEDKDEDAEGTRLISALC
jgi:hypothetical protein